MAGVRDIHEHAIDVDKKKQQVKCIYCWEEVKSFNRLKTHLSGVVHKDILPCELVPDIVRETFRDMVSKDKPGFAAAKRVGQVQGNGHKRARTEEDSSTKSVSAANVNIDVEANKRARSKDSSGRSFSTENGSTDVEADKRARSEDSSSISVPTESGSIDVEADKQDLFSNRAQKCIARFFYENYIDFSAVDSPSFKEMMMTVGSGGGQMGLKFPDSHELNGRMLQETLKEVQDHVKKIKDSWKITGCSILLDAWVDQKGRELVMFVADCPAGPVYLRSFDVSDIKDDITELTSLVDELVKDVGVGNVIQIITFSTSGWVGELGKLFARNKKELFLSVSLSHCINLMLRKIGEMDFFGDILDKVNKIWEFFKDKPSVLKVFRDHSHGIDMITTVSSSEYEFLTPYLTLESLFKAKSDLEAMFAVSDWSKEEGIGITISKLVNDSSFWETVERFVNCTSTLVHGSLLFSNANNQHVGYIYDAMNCIKESIAMEFNHEKLIYKPLWDGIDNVWNEHLHSPLHAAGYFLNPASFYSTDFHLDPKVATGLISSLVLMVKESSIQTKIASQLDMYGQGKDCFKEASQPDQIDGISPVEWWAQKGSQHQELQSFAIKIMSQTCEGASRYKLKRSVAEKLLLSEGMSLCEQKHLEELAFVHYNLHLQSCKNQIQ